MDELERMPELLKGTAFRVTGGLEGYERYTHADRADPDKHRLTWLRRVNSPSATQLPLAPPSNMEPLIIERTRVPDERSTGITTRTDTVLSQSGRPILTLRGGTAVKE